MKKFDFSTGRKLRPLGMGLLILIAILAVIGIYSFITFNAINKKAKALVTSAKDLKYTFTQNNIDLVNDKLNDFSNKYKDFEDTSKSIYWATFIPYIADFKNGVEAGNYLVKAAKETVVAVSPYADLIGFKKGQVSFVEKSAEDRLQTAILTLDKVLSKVDSISEDIKQAEVRIEKIDSKRYPEKIGKTAVRGTIENVKEQFNGLSSLFVEAKPLVKRLPEIFGKDNEKTYLVLFQNDKELRATGGFLTSYAVFKVKNGKIQIQRSEDIYTLDNSISAHPTAPREILTYHKNISVFNIRDSNLSPDLPASINLFNSLYKKSGEKVNYDGIIMIDSKVLVDMLTIFGDTEADGIRFSAKKDVRCDCPQVLYTLFDLVDRPVGYIKENRKGILGDLMYALFYKAIGFSPSKYWGTLIQQMFTNMQEKHILIYFVDPELEKSLVKLNFGGTINDYAGDYLHINNVNFAGAKANMFTTESFTSKTNTNDNGKITREVNVEFRNPYPMSDCNLERGGLCLNAPLRNWIRLYVPKGSQLIDFQGSQKKVQTYDELGKTVFEGFLIVDPQGKANVIVKYSLPSNVKADNYSLMVQKQPGTDNQKLVVSVNGKELYNGILDTDKEIKAK